MSMDLRGAAQGRRVHRKKLPGSVAFEGAVPKTGAAKSPHAPEEVTESWQCYNREVGKTNHPVWEQTIRVGDYPSCPQCGSRSALQVKTEH